MIRCDFLCFRFPVQPESSRTSRVGSGGEGRGQEGTGGRGVIDRVISRSGSNEYVDVVKGNEK